MVIDVGRVNATENVGCFECWLLKMLVVWVASEGIVVIDVGRIPQMLNFGCFGVNCG